MPAYKKPRRTAKQIAQLRRDVVALYNSTPRLAISEIAAQLKVNMGDVKFSLARVRDETPELLPYRIKCASLSARKPGTHYDTSPEAQARRKRLAEMRRVPLHERPRKVLK